MPTSPLRQLADIISTSVDKIDTAFSAANLQYPSLNEPFNPTSPNEGLSMSPEVIQAATLAVAACAQLSATINVPALSLYDAVGGVSLLDHHSHASDRAVVPCRFRPACCAGRQHCGDIA